MWCINSSKGPDAPRNDLRRKRRHIALNNGGEVTPWVSAQLVAMEHAVRERDSLLYETVPADRDAEIVKRRREAVNRGMVDIMHLVQKLSMQYTAKLVNNRNGCVQRGGD